MVGGAMVLWCYGGGAAEELWRSCGGAVEELWRNGGGAVEDYTDYTEVERREDGAPVEAGSGP